jgi:histidinol-phosphatase
VARDLGDDLQLALQLADIADAITMPRFRAEDLQVETKPDLTPVTESDKAVELAIRERLQAVCPGDAVIGEEFGGSEVGGAGGSDGAPASGRVWILDPIDGTKSYVRGMPTWSTLIALQIDGEMAVGVVAMPALGRRWWASRGGGAFADGKRLRVSNVASLSDTQMAYGGIEDWDALGATDRLLELVRACWRTRGVGDAWQYMLVAEGIAEIGLDPEVSIWDIAAVAVIVEEAGGRFTDLDGERGEWSSSLATNGLVHEEALKILSGAVSGSGSGH